MKPLVYGDRVRVYQHEEAPFKATVMAYQDPLVFVREDGKDEFYKRQVFRYQCVRLRKVIKNPSADNVVLYGCLIIITITLALTAILVYTN